MKPDLLFQAPPTTDRLRIVPMGGCGEFGMNLTAYLGSGKLVVVDCGLRFTDPAKLGADAIIPAVDPWFAMAGGVHSYLITHGHEDHVGALPYIVPRWPAPIYATAWTAEVIRNRFLKNGVDPDAHPVTVVEPGDRVAAPGFDCEYVGVNHSIPMACALVIRTPAGTVFHTGDFKFDATPLMEASLSERRLAELGDEGIDLLLADSTNADKDGMCPSESSVLEPLCRVFAASPGAVIIATFASNFWRLKLIADACLRTGRRLYVTGPGCDQSFGIAAQLGMYRLPEGLRLAENQLDQLPRDQLVVLATGCQGEYRAALNRIAHGEHRAFKVRPGDCVVLSSRIIPGNERTIFALCDQLRRAGATIITTREAPGIHVSGHAYRGDLELLRSHLRPRWYTPVHGTFTQLAANLDGAQQQAHPQKPTPQASPEDQSQSLGQIIENGDVLELSRAGVATLGRIVVDHHYIDADANVAMPYETLRERLRIGELGAALVSGVFERRLCTWRAPVAIDLIGLRLPLEINTEEWLKALARQTQRLVEDLADAGQGETDAILEQARIFVRRQLNQVLHKKPVVFAKLQLV